MSLLFVHLCQLLSAGIAELAVFVGPTGYPLGSAGEELLRSLMRVAGGNSGGREANVFPRMVDT